MHSQGPLPILPCPDFASFSFCHSPSVALHPQIGPRSFVQEPGTTPVPFSLKPSGYAVPQPGREDTAGSVSQLSPPQGRKTLAGRHAPLACSIRTHRSPSQPCPGLGGSGGQQGLLKCSTNGSCLPAWCYSLCESPNKLDKTSPRRLLQKQRWFMQA